MASLATGCRKGPGAPATTATTATTPTTASTGGVILPPGGAFTPAVPTTVALPLPPYPIRTVTLPLVDAGRPTVSRGVRISPTRALTTVVWAPTVGAQWPLVIFAPGYQAGPDTYAELCRAWAAHGYVVAAPEFPLSDPAVAGAALDENDLDHQPGDVNFVINSLVDSSSPLAAVIDPTRIAVTGHSDGAEAALAVAQQGDPRIRAVIAMSGQPVVPHQAPNPPLLAIQGDRDTINPPVRSLAVYQQASAPRFLLTLFGASHLEPFAGQSKWRPVVQAVTTHFLDHYLAGILGNDDGLAAAASHPGLSSLR